LLFIYQGLLTRARGVDELLDAFCGVGEELHIVFMGNGPLKSLILNAANEYPNIHYHKPVSSDQVLKYTGEADIGIHIIQNTCLNHYYCLPNKIFEYLMAGIPFIVSDFPEMSKVVADTGGGWTCKPNKKELMKKINSISREEIDLKKVNIQINLEKYGWQIEELKYIDIYERLKKNVQI
jgi:glycosyltransferase involved in cell wall biosynthesis